MEVTETTDSMKIARYLARTAAILACAMPVCVSAADVGGGIRIGASHSDNVFLATTPNEIDDIIYQASPYLTILHTSPGFDANFDYTFDWYRYSDLDSTTRFHRGEATVVGRAWQDSLQTTLGARRSQTLSDPEDVIPSGRLPLSGNLVDEDEYWFNPQFMQSLGSSVTLATNYLYSIVEFDDPLVQDQHNQMAMLSVENYSAGQGLTWALRYNWRRTEYDLSTPWENQRAGAELGFWVNQRTRIFAGGGKESVWNNPFDPSMDDSYWEAGFAHTAGDTLSIEIAVGERSFGTSLRGTIDYRFRRGSTSVRYVEAPTTTGFNDPARSRSVIQSDDLDGFLDRPGSAERFLSERLEWNLDLQFRRTALTLVVFDESRDGRVTADGLTLADQSETGVRASLSWQAGSRTTFVASGALFDQEISSANKSRLSSAGLRVNYTLGARSSLSLGYSYDEQEPRGQVGLGRNYVANVVSLFFTLTL